MVDQDDYASWPREKLIERLKVVEAQLKQSKRPDRSDQTEGGAPTAKKQKRERREPDPSKYSTRNIALKFAYLGKNYNGFEYQPTAELPTIEGELWKALTKAYLIMPEDPATVSWDGLDYSKCGRTDKGVSAFGQVISLKVRSNRPLPRPRLEGDREAAVDEVEGAFPEPPPFHDINDEIDYVGKLNRLLPPEIRVLAWCPHPPEGFSARYSCEERVYRYFFTQPSFLNHSVISGCGAATDMHATAGAAWLDIEAMNKAAEHFVGLHDFRNFCKVDGSKQITNFERRILSASIEEVPGGAGSSQLPWLHHQGGPDSNNTDSSAYPRLFSFNVRGTAFLWHQIRHMVAVLFLVGQGLESPDVVAQLLDVSRTPRKPNYCMADEVPLVLWDCKYPDGMLSWVYPDGSSGQHSTTDRLWQVWRERKVDEVLANQLLNLAAADGRSEDKGSGFSAHSGNTAAGALFVAKTARKMQKKQQATLVFEGGNKARSVGKYVPLMQLRTLETPEEQNDKWARSKGFASSQAMKENGNWLQALRDKKGQLAESGDD